MDKFLVLFVYNINNNLFLLMLVLIKERFNIFKTQLKLLKFAYLYIISLNKFAKDSRSSL